MNDTTPRGLKIWGITPSPSGFGEYEATGPVFVRKDSITPAPEFDGLIRNQTGPAIRAITWDGDGVVGMKA